MSTRREFIQSVQRRKCSFRGSRTRGQQLHDGGRCQQPALATQQGSSTEIWPCHRGYKRCRYSDEVTILRKAIFQA
jgi:hypothetical protein